MYNPDEKMKRILVIDDEEEIRSSFRRYLAEYDYDVLEAESGQTGLEKFEIARPDLVLTDLRMPGIDGLDVVAAVIHHAPYTPILIVSGTGNIRDAIEALHLGAWDYLLKPVEDLSILRHAVERAFERSHLLREKEAYHAHLEREVEENRAYQKRLEQLVAERTRELRQSEARFRALIEQAPVAIVLGRGELLSYANPPALRLFGVENLVGVAVRELIAPECREEIEDWLRRRMAGQAVETEHETIALRADGSRFPLHFFADLINLSDGPAFAVFATDVTEQKRAQDKLARLAVAVEQAADEIVITDREGTIEYVNSAVERTTGYSRAEVLGRNPRIFKSGRHDAAFYRELWETLLEGNVWQGRLINRTKNGREILLDSSIAPIRIASGAIVGFVAARRDVTLQAELEAHLAQAQRIEAIGTLAGGIAHDFNNILSAVIGYAELAQMSLPQSAKAYGDLQNALQAADRAKALVTQILAFCRMDEQEVQFVHPAPLVKEALKFLRASISAAVEICHEITGSGAVLGDPGELHRIVVNLCTNAALAIGERGGLLEVHLEDMELDESSATLPDDIRPGKFLRLTVRDTGCGMTKEVKMRIFEPFFTTRPAGEGTGMGLAVVREIVEKRGGFIAVKSEPGQGTTFEVYLPAADHVEPTREDAQELLLTGSERILLIDDESSVRDVTSKLLGRLGYRVRAFESGLEAVACFEEDPSAFDLVITDLEMPKLSGEEVARRLRFTGSDIPMILCTGIVEKMPAERAERLGFCAVEQKPLSLASMSQVLRRVLDRC